MIGWISSLRSRTSNQTPTPAPNQTPPLDVGIDADADASNGAAADPLGAAPNIDGNITLHAGAPSVIETEPEPASTLEPASYCWVSPERHAELLLKALIHWGFGGRVLFSCQVTRAHEVMCDRLGVWCEPWPVVAAAFRKLLRQNKRYKYIRRNDGKRVRLRIYSIPQRVPASLRLISGGRA
jgi:hypothetical protein